MSIFTTIGHKHLKGIHETKDLTAHKEVITFEPDAVYIPLVDPVTAKPLKLNVAINDEVKVGTVIGIREDSGIPVFATVSGKITREETFLHANLGRNVKHFVIENNKKNEKEPPLKIYGDDVTKEQIVERMKEAGLLGFGGAGFPTYRKYANVRGIDTIIINAVECEPFLTDDYQSLLKNKEGILEGIELLMKASGAQKAFLAFKKDHLDLVEHYKDTTELHPNIQVFPVKNVYPSGWERHLIKEVTGRTYNRLPSEAHVIVNNVESTLRVYKAIKLGEVVTRKIITVSGTAIKNQNNVELPIYTKASDIINLLGGYTQDDVSLSFGGPMCSRGVMNDSAVIISYTSGLVVLPRLKVNTINCLRCGTCTDHCPSGLQPVEIKIAQQSKNMDRMMALTPWHCVGCGLCSYVCPSKIDVIEYVKKAKLLTMAQLKKGGK